MLRIENLSYRYPKRRTDAVMELTLDLHAGGIYGLLGPNGAGKTTLLHLIAGLLTPSSGKVTFKGIDTRRRLPGTLNDIIIVPEELTLPDVTLESYVRMNAPLYPRFSQADLYKHLSTFEIEHVAGQKLSNLSMGQKKKTFMCFALACNPSLLLMDEPTNGLDIPGKAAFRRFIASSVDENKTVVISTHQVHDVERLLDHVVILDDTRIALNAPTVEIMRRLSFINTADRALIDRALVAINGIGGAEIIVPNEGDGETEINLETLFELATGQPDVIARLFNTPKCDI